ncbi:MAG: hypothetical protein ABIB47_03120 [Candidatus Woesearchaeota archaeon]
MGAEIWISIILKIIFLLVAAHIAITKIVPLLNDFLLSFIKNKSSVNSFTSLIDIFILVLVGSSIVTFLLEANNAILNYISVLQPAFEVLKELFVYLQWILLVLIAVVAIKNLKH